MPTKPLRAPSSPSAFCRTDLACESPTPATESAEAVIEIGGHPVTLTRRREPDGGRNATLSVGRITEWGEKDLSPLSELLARELTDMATALLGHSPDPHCRILVAGLGNPAMTPDAIGPGTVNRMTVTRHLLTYDRDLFAALGCCELSAITPDVLGQTGMEAADLVKCAADLVDPHLIVAIDALAAADCERLSSTIQLSDSGISPGAGIGNRRTAINSTTMNRPVMGIGIPTVVDSATLVWDALARGGMKEDSLPPTLIEVLTRGRSFVVSPKDCDEVVDLSCRLLAMSLDRAFGVGDL